MKSMSAPEVDLKKLEILCMNSTWPENYEYVFLFSQKVFNIL